MTFHKQQTMEAFLDAWLETVIKASVRYSTYTSYKGYVANHIKRHLGDLLLSQTKPQNIQDFVAKLVDESTLSPRTIGIIYGVLKCALGYAEDYELISKNPCHRIRLPKVEEDEVKIFDQSEQTRIEKAVFRQNDNRYYAVLFTLYTGVRIGELCALRWENIDLHAKCVHIKKSLGRAACVDGSGKKTVMVESEPKTKRSKRTIPLPDFLVGILKKLKADSCSQYVFCNKHGGYIHPRTMQLLLKKLLKIAKVDYNNFHVLRHTFASRAGETADAKTVSETLGHSNVMITLNRYMHSSREQKRKMMNALNLSFNKKNIPHKDQ